MGKLITYNPSFDWSNYLIDRTKSIYDLNAAITEFASTNDVIYKTPDLYDIDQPWGVFFNFLWTTGNDYDSFNQRYPWILRRTFQTLINIMPRFMRPNTPKNSRSRDEMSLEFPDDNTGWVGFFINCHVLLVHNYETWYEFHKVFVSTYDFRSKRKNLPYIRRFYNPQLTGITAGQLKALIKKGNSHPTFNGLHDPTIVENDQTLHGEKLHVHFTDGSALYIDGKWKHRVKNAEIANEALEILEEWGFLLPDEYYVK